MDRLRLRVRSLIRGHSLDRELANELRFHLDQQIRENRQSGMSAAEALAAAHRAFGSVGAIEERCRDMRRVAYVENLGRDLRHALRALFRQPLLVLTAAASIGVGVAANTTVVRLATDLLMTAPTVRDPDRLVHIRMGSGSHVSYRQWRDLERTNALAGLAGYQIEQEVNWQADDRAITLLPLIVTANFFDVLGVPVAMGRGFSAEEADAERDPRVAVVSHQFWQRQLAADAAVVGRTLVINGERYTILGVLPSTLRALPGYGLAPQVYLPLSRALVPNLLDVRGAAVQLVGRLQGDQQRGQGRAALETAAAALSAGYGIKEFARVDQFTPVTQGPRDFPGVTSFFTLLLVVVGLLLAIACANVTGLLLARNASRAHDLALRMSLGASRGRLLQQLLVEGFWLSLMGTIVGVCLALAILQALGRVPVPLPVPLELRAAFDLRLLAYSAVLVVGATLFSAVTPALQATRAELLPSFRQAEPRFGHRRWSFRATLVTGQVGVSCLLLVTALLFVRNLARTNAASPGFDTVRTMSAEVGFIETRHTRDLRALLLADAVERVQGLPEVEAASVARGVPLTLRSGRTTGATIQLADGPSFGAQYEENMVGPGYFRTMGLVLKGGRDFGPGDSPGAPSVIIVNEEFVRRYLSDRNPLGTTLMLPGLDAAEPSEIVGVVGNSKYRTLGEAQQAAMYSPFVQRGNTGRFAHVLVRVTGDPEAMKPVVRHAIAALDATLAVEVRTMTEALAFAFLPSRLGAGLLGTLGALALVLAAGGLFAMLSFSVSRRTREIAVRLALGASRLTIVSLVSRESAAAVITGLTIGLAVAAWVTGPISMFLVTGLSAHDLVSFAGTAALFVAVSLLATLLPVRRALQIEPAVTLRDE